MRKWSIRVLPWLWAILVFWVGFKRAGPMTGLEAAIALIPVFLTPFLVALWRADAFANLREAWQIVRGGRISKGRVAAIALVCIIVPLVGLELPSLIRLVVGWVNDPGHLGH